LKLKNFYYYSLFTKIEKITASGNNALLRSAEFFYFLLLKKMSFLVLHEVVGMVKLGGNELFPLKMSKE